MIEKEELVNLIYNLISKASCILPEKTMRALEEAYEKETELFPKLHMESTIRNMNLSREKMIQLCGDTGYPIFYIRTCSENIIPGGMPAIYNSIKEAVRKATDDAWLRPTVVDPLTRENPGNNIGAHMPYVVFKFDSAIDYMEITAAPKGGGTEIFGSNFRVLLHADGIRGIKYFVLESIRDSSKSGSACPPNIVGIGIGGTADISAKLAKEAAILREIGERHPEERIARLELELLDGINSLGIGALGMGGKTTALDVHIEYALTHLIGFPVAICLQCAAARVATARIYPDGSYKIVDWPDWFQRRG